MNKLSKILIFFIAILTIALAIMTFQYFNMRNIAKKNFNDFINATTELYSTKYNEIVPDTNN